MTMKHIRATSFILFCLYFTTNSYKITWDENAKIDADILNGETYDENIKEIRLPNLFIFPGTKWCGTGNIANDDNDYGKEEETDRCCQAHDYCPDIIRGYQNKYGLTNLAFYTRLNCQCDEQFYECLKDVDRPSSRQIGFLYFTGLRTQCFKKDYPIIGCKKYTIFPKLKCKEYNFDPTGEMKYQWFDLPNF